MSTPTPMKHAASQQGRTPSQMGAVNTPPVSTPFSQAHAAFSPHGPRSSPQHVKKSPATTATLMGHPSNGPINFDSPSAAAALGALGIGGSLDIGLDNASVSGLMRRMDEEDRMKRLDSVIEIIDKAANGVVSEAGLERLARRTGLDYFWEDGIGKGPKTRTLIIAGSALALDIVLANNIVQNVTLSFPESSNSVTKHVAQANQILFDDLRLLPDQSPLTKRLNKFRANLQHLVTLDKLSVMPGLNCHEAVVGIYESLEKLYKWDLDKLGQDPELAGQSEEVLRIRALCSRHGYPAMHSRDRVGLGLDYWTPESSPGEPRTWSILVGCAPYSRVTPSAGMDFPSVRVSDKWISNDIEKANPTQEDLLAATTGSILDWQEPEATLLPSDEEKPEAGVTDLSGPRLPEVVFLATFDPPLVVPYSAGEHIRQVTGASSAASYHEVYDTLMFPIPPGTHHDSSEMRTIGSSQEVVLLDKEKKSVRTTHTNVLCIYKRVYGRILDEVPFSHPRQLIEMLPTLRQYALLSAILERFTAEFEERPNPEIGAGDAITVTTTSIGDDFARFMSMGEQKEGKGQGEGELDPEQPQSIKIDVVLSTHPVPKLQVVFPHGHMTASIVLEIGLNGVIHVESENICDQGTGECKTVTGKPFKRQDLGTLMEAFVDINTWCSWIRKRLVPPERV